MNKNQIVNYLIMKIPDYSCTSNIDKHIFQFSVHVYPFIARGNLHPFVNNLTNALQEIEQVLPGYSKKTIDWIASIDKSHFEQIIQILSELLILRKLVSIASPKSIELEPSAINNGKNPEFRARVNEASLAIEVKTASLFDFSNQRQTGLQIISQLDKVDYQILKETGKIVNSRSLKVKDYLISADMKFEQYKKKEEYQNDFRLLFIIWDDYINEPINALVNPHSGLLTANSFLPDSNFNNVDGVVVIRHIHQFFRNLQFGEIVDYGLKGVHDSFDYVNQAIAAVYAQNPKGRKIPSSILESFNVDKYEHAKHFHVAEYQYTDFIDWKTGLSLSGIYDLPESLRAEILEFFIDISRNEIPTSYKDISLFDNYDISNGYNTLLEKYHDSDMVKVKLFELLNDLIEMRRSISKDNLLKLEKEASTRAKRNKYYKKLFDQYYSADLHSNCSCSSNVIFKNCCFIKLKHFEYVKYHRL